MQQFLKYNRLDERFVMYLLVLLEILIKDIDSFLAGLYKLNLKRVQYLENNGGAKSFSKL
jgi:hypothetical protein